MRGLNSAPTYQLLDHLDRTLHALSTRANTLASGVCAECSDELGWLSKDAADLRVIVEILRDRERFPRTKPKAERA